MERRKSSAYSFRIKVHSGKKYLYKIWNKRVPAKKYPVQTSLFVGDIDKIKKVVNYVRNND